MSFFLFTWIETEGETTPELHSADLDGDGQIILNELLRVIQFL